VVKISISKLILAVAVLPAVLGFAILASWASQFGDEKWCAVSNNGGAAAVWDCEFETADDCSPAILVGNRGYCALNPYYRPPQQQPQPANPQR
jgi:Protein of unknown function (DUF3551)